MCTSSKQVAVTRRLFGAQTANLEEWECELVFQFNMAKIHALSHWLIYILSQRLIADVYTRYDNAAIAQFVAAMCHTNSNQLEFVRHIAATKFCRSDLFVARMHHVTRGDRSQQYVAATCCRDIHWPCSNSYLPRELNAFLVQSVRRYKKNMLVKATEKKTLPDITVGLNEVQMIDNAR